jgi:hypothetical protein
LQNQHFEQKEKFERLLTGRALPVLFLQFGQGCALIIPRNGSQQFFQGVALAVEGGEAVLAVKKAGEFHGRSSERKYSNSCVTLHLLGQF